MSNSTFKPFVQTEKKFLDKIAKQDAGSLRTVTTIIVRFNMWTKLEHDSKAELFAQALATDFRETNSPERAFEMIQDYIDWCHCDPEKREVKGEIMSHIYFEVGSSKRGARRLKKISANTLDHEIWYILKYLRKVGGLTIDKYDFLDNLTMPKKVMVDQEDAILLENDMAQAIFEFAPDTRHTKPLLRMSNDTAFREKEALLTQEKNLKLDGDRPTVTLEQWKSKGGRTLGTRKLFPPTVKLLKRLLTEEPDRYVLMTKKHSDIINGAELDTKEGKQILDDIINSYETNQTQIYNRIREKCYKKTGDERYIEKYEHNGFYKINIHSWRKRAGSYFADANGVDMSHGFLRHEAYLPQYMLKSKESRLKMIDGAQPLMEFDEMELERFESIKKDVKISELIVKDKKIASLEDKLDNLTSKVNENSVIELINKVLAEKPQN